MNIIEKEIEDLIYQASEYPDTLTERGLYMPNGATIFRQLNLGEYGIADIVAVKVHERRNGYRMFEVHVYELKKETVNAATLLQAIGYGKAIYRILSIKMRRVIVNTAFHLVGKKIETGSNFVFLPDLIGNVFLYEYQLDFYEGMTFRECRNYHLTNPCFPSFEKQYSEINKTIKRKNKRVVVSANPSESIDDLIF